MSQFFQLICKYTRNIYKRKAPLRFIQHNRTQCRGLGTYSCLWSYFIVILWDDRKRPRGAAYGAPISLHVFVVLTVRPWVVVGPITRPPNPSASCHNICTPPTCNLCICTVTLMALIFQSFCWLFSNFSPESDQWSITYLVRAYSGPWMQVHDFSAGHCMMVVSYRKIRLTPRSTLLSNAVCGSIT